MDIFYTNFTKNCSMDEKKGLCSSKLCQPVVLKPLYKLGVIQSLGNIYDFVSRGSFEKDEGL